MIDIFVSYAHEDRERIQPLIAVLERQGWKIWWDTDIEAGVRFDIEIETAVQMAKCVIVLWSEHSIDSQWVRSEAHEGFNRNILVPALIDDVQPPLPFRLLQATNFFAPPLGEQSDFTGLVKAVRHTLKGESIHVQDFESGVVQPWRKRIFGKSGYPALTLLAILLVLLYVANSQLFNPDPVANPKQQDQAEVFRPPENSIAVLPFLNMSDDAANEYFSDGISEEILNSLASLGSFKVTARSSSFSLRDQHLDIPTIGQRLNVARLLEGSVRKQGNKVRISAQLVSAIDGSQLWASTYDRELGDIFTVQEDISRNIVKLLELTMDDNKDALLVKRPSVDFEAFDMYLLGRHYWYKRTVESIEVSINLFKQSIEIDPDFVLAYTGLADAYNLLTAYGDLSGQEAAALMRPIVEKAIELDGSLAEVHTSFGAMLGNQGMLDLEEAEYRKAIEISKNYALAYIWLGNNLLVQGQLEEGIKIHQQALSLDPMNPAVILNLARSKMYLGQSDQALRYVVDAEALEPDSALVFEQKAWVLREFGRLDESLKSALKAAELDPEGAQVLAGVAESQLALGNLDAANVWIEQASQYALDNWHVVWAKSENFFLRGELEAFEAFTKERLSFALKDDSHSGPDLKAVYLWAGLASLQSGSYSQATRYFDAAFSPKIKHQFEAQHELRFRAYRILAHRLAGEIATADSLLDEALSYIAARESQGWKVPGFQFHAASIYVLAGNRETAFEYLTQAVDNGFRYLLLFEKDPVLQSLHDAPTFKNLRSVIQRDLTRMRQAIDTR